LIALTSINLSDDTLLSRCRSVQMHETHYYWLWG